MSLILDLGHAAISQRLLILDLAVRALWAPVGHSGLGLAVGRSVVLRPVAEPSAAAAGGLRLLVV